MIKIGGDEWGWCIGTPMLKSTCYLQTPFVLTKLKTRDDENAEKKRNKTQNYYIL